MEFSWSRINYLDRLACEINPLTPTDAYVYVRELGRRQAITY